MTIHERDIVASFVVCLYLMIVFKSQQKIHVRTGGKAVSIKICCA